MIKINIEKSVVRNDINSHYVIVEYNGIPLELGIGGSGSPLVFGAGNNDQAYALQTEIYEYIRLHGVEKFINFITSYHDLTVDEIC